MEVLIDGSKRNKAFISAILPSMLEQLGLTRSRKTLYIRVANEGADHNDGETHCFDMIDSYVILLKPTRQLEKLGVTLAHELVHVRQLAKGILKSLGNGKRMWAGKVYGKKTKYLDMPWEIDAYAQQELVFRRAIDC